MKKILILSCLFLFFVSSCSNQEEVIVGDGLDYDNMSEEDLRKCAEANGAITWNQFIELMGEFMESEQSPLIETKAMSETFSVTGYDNTFLVEENKKFLSTNHLQIFLLVITFVISILLENGDPSGRNPGSN